MKAISLIIAICTLVACQQTNKQTNTNKQNQNLLISVSIPPQSFIAEAITAPLSKINTMVTDKQNPHTYVPQPKQIQNLTKANVYVKLNLPHISIEDKINSILKDNNIKIINMSKNVELIYEDDEHKDDGHKDDGHKDDEHKDDGHKDDEHGHNSSVDPHIWLSTQNIRIAAENIYNEIIKIDPDNKDTYSNNLKTFIKEIYYTERIVKEILKNKKNRQFLIYHPTLAYFAKENNLEQIAIEKEGKEISTKHLQSINEKIKLYKIKSILVQKGFNQQNAKVIAKENNLKVITINPLKRDLLDNIKTIAKIIKEN